MEDIEDGIEKYYRNLISEELESCMQSAVQSYSDDEKNQVYWFNQGLSYAIMIARWGIK